MNNHHRPQTPLPGPDCESFAPLLALVGQERLAPRDARDLRGHLATCAYCQQELETYNWLDDALARHYGPVPRGPLSLSDVRTITSRDYQPRTPPPEPLAAPETPREPRPSHPERLSHTEPPRPPMRQPRSPRGRRIISILSAVAAVLIIAAVSLALFESRTTSNNGKQSSTSAPSPTNIYVPQQQDNLISVSMVSPGEGWAVGDTALSPMVSQSLILHYIDGHWIRVSGLTNTDLHATSSALTQIVMLSASDGWAIGNLTMDTQTNANAYFGAIFHYTGGRWTLQQTIANGSLSAFAMTSPTDGWAVGTIAANGSQQGQSLLLHYNGQTWTRVQAPGGQLTTIAMASASDGWATGLRTDANGNPVGVDLHYNGHQWTQVSIPPIDVVVALSTRSASDGWAMGYKYLPNGRTNALYSGTPWQNVFAHYDGKTWTAVQTPILNNENASVSSLFMDAPNDGWAVGIAYTDAVANPLSTNLYLHYSSGQWTQVNGPGSEGLNAVFLTSASEGWAVGKGGTIMHYANGAWTQAAGAPAPTPLPTATPTGTPQPTACTSHSGPTGASSTPGAVVTPEPLASWSTYTNTTYHYTLKYPANWVLDNLNCPDSAYLAFWNYNYVGWNGPGAPPGAIKIELSAEENSTGLSALDFLQMQEQIDQNAVGGPSCTAFTNTTLTVGGHDAAEESCTMGEVGVAIYVPDGSTMLRISDDFAANGQPSDVFNQMIASLMFTN